VGKGVDSGEVITRISDLKGSAEDKILKLVEESDGFAEIYPGDKYLLVALITS